MLGRWMRSDSRTALPKVAHEPDRVPGHIFSGPEVLVERSSLVAQSLERAASCRLPPQTRVPEPDARAGFQNQEALAAPARRVEAGRAAVHCRRSWLR